jgi:hypothetical protein
MKDQFHAKGKKARTQQIVAGPSRLEIETIVDGRSTKVQINGRVIATSQTPVDPRKGPTSVLWNVNIMNLDTGEFTPYLQGRSYKEVRATLAAIQLETLGRHVDPAHPTTADQRYVRRQKSKLPGHNVLNSPAC